MDSIVNYESDEANSKVSKKSSSKGSSKKEKRRKSSDDDSSDDSGSARERGRKRLNEDSKKSSAKRSSPSPRKSSKSSRSDKHKAHERDRHRNRSSSRDSDKIEKKKRKVEDREDKKKHRRRSKDREKRRSESRDRDDKDRKNKNNDRRKDKYDDRKRSNRREDERRYDDRKDNSQRRDEPSHRNNNRNTNDNRSSSSSSNSSSAMRRAEALNRTIERRANEKVQQLQKLGIEIPALMQQQQLLKAQQSIKPLMSISTGVAGASFPNMATSSTNETKTDTDNLTLNLSNFTSPVLTNARYTEQMQKKKLIWGAKKVAAGPEITTTNNKWEAAKFSQDSDGKVASKFLRLMGMKNAPTNVSTSEDGETSVQKREQMFSSMEQQYEVARQATHTMRGMGLGFGSQSRPC